MAAASPSASVNNIWFFGLHGGVNGSGVLTSGMDFLASTVGTTYATQNVPVSGTVPAAIATIPCNQSTLAVNVIGTHTMTFRPFTWNESGGNNPTPALFFGGTTDYPSTGVVVTTQIYAASRNFFATAQTSPISANLRFCLLYE
jgi:hypothetical protein